MSILTTQQEDEVIDSYLTCAFWSGLDYYDENEEPRPLDENYGPDDLAREAYVQLRDEVLDFLGGANQDALGLWVREFGAGAIGHDFCLTRNPHVSGFWDRSYGGNPVTAAGDALTEWADLFGESDLYVGDDKQVWV